MIWLSIVVIACALCAVVSMTPDRLPASLVIFYWLFSFMGQAFALPMFFVSLGLAFISPALAAVIFAVAASLFGVAHWRNRRAGRLMLDAAGLRDLKLPLDAGLLPFLTGRSRVRKLKGLAYGDDPANRLDIIVGRRPPPVPMPILIHVHGGGWVTGKKDQQAKPLLYHLAPRGWLCFDIDYRLGPAHRGPAWIIDVLKAIAWVRAHAAEYGGDPDRIALTGGSAGGHLTALAALAHDDPAFKPGFEDADCSVAAAVPMYGRYDFLDRAKRLRRNHEAVIDKFVGEKVMPGKPSDCLDLWHEVSPIDRLRPDAPPMFLAHGTGDTLLPHQEAEEFARALKAVSAAAVTYVELPGIQHGWDMANSAVAWAQARAIEAFLAPLKIPR